MENKKGELYLAVNLLLLVEVLAIQAFDVWRRLHVQTKLRR